MTGSHRFEADENKSLEEQILEKIDEAATTAQLPAQVAMKRADRLRNAVIGIGIYFFVLTLAVSYAIYRVEHNADQNTRYLIESCIINNESRALEKALWDTILVEDLELEKAEGYKPSKAEQAAMDRIIAVIAKTYPQRDCSKVTKGMVVESPPPVPPKPKGTPNGSRSSRAR